MVKVCRAPPENSRMQLRSRILSLSCKERIGRKAVGKQGKVRKAEEGEREAKGGGAERKERIEDGVWRE